MYLHFPFGFMFMHFLLACSAVTRTNITNDQYGLLALKAHMINSKPYQILAKNWSVEYSVCQWIGVTCGIRHQRVIALNISNMGLTGIIPPQLGNLSFLGLLDLRENNFYGELPYELAHLRRLRVLDFGMNNLNGELPFWLGSFHKLRYLSLRNNSFTGVIPPSISNISSLQQLWLSFNNLKGTVPVGIGNLNNLNTLVIEHNQLSGPLPVNIFNISTLETFSLAYNSLTGSLPIHMCDHLQRLRWLNLEGNSLNGEIPSNISQCSKLQILSLTINNFSGFLPNEVGNLKMLEYLYLGYNENLKGVIPKHIGNLTMLKTLGIANSSLTGVIPQEVSNLFKLQQMDLAFNSLSGSVPVGIFNLSTITQLSLSGNHLVGNLPSSMGYGLPNLQELYLFANDFAGVIPSSISNSSSLTVVELSTNNFMGSIPNSLGNLRLLEWVSLANNNLTSDSPSQQLDFIDSLANCKNLIFMQLTGNPLNGFLPDSVGNLSSFLEEFDANNCKIMGKIPDGIGNLSNLIALDLSENELTASVPTRIRDLQKLQMLKLSKNKLQKVILEDLCVLQSLGFIYLSQNQIAGSIPECLGNGTSLRSLYLDSNKLNSSIPAKFWNLKDLLELKLSSNFLTGSLPPEIGNLKVATTIDLSTNYFSGYLPNSLGGLQNLHLLSLAHNRMDGSIPESVGEMFSLESLDLSHNNLSGSIPRSLKTLRSLKYLNVSFNNLRGEIPDEGCFQNFTSKSFVHNEALCGDQRFGVDPCPAMSNHKSRTKIDRDTIFLVFGILVATVVTIGLGVLYLRYRKSYKVSNREDLLSLTTQERIQYYEVLQATNEFDESNLLGRGSFGSVYKGTFSDGRILAIKVFNLQLEEAFKSFEIECQVLRNLRHRNLTKVVSSCSNLDFKALLIEFMPNGSLEKWLYSHNYFLDMKQRLKIMIDVACALHYLHHGNSTPVVHCDLKPSNILLDEDMVAHVSDFGIARLLSHDDSTTCTETLATYGYIAPEFGLEGLVSKKCDIYSFGIMLMEVFTRMKPNNCKFKENLSLRDWVNGSMPNALIEVVDANLLRAGDEYFIEQLKCVESILKVALNCSRESPSERSSIGDVLAALKKIELQLLQYHKEA